MAEPPAERDSSRYGLVRETGVLSDRRESRVAATLDSASELMESRPGRREEGSLACDPGGVAWYA